VTKPDGYAWRPIGYAAAVGAIAAAWRQFLNFVPCCETSTNDVSNARLVLDILWPIGFLLLMGFAALLLVMMALAVVKRRFRRLLLFACAVVAIFFIPFLPNWLAVLSPYYWYVLFNQSRLEGAARAAHPGPVSFATLEQRDVSTGFATDLTSFMSIIYDESDELGRSPERRTPHGTPGIVRACPKTRIGLEPIARSTCLATST